LAVGILKKQKGIKYRLTPMGTVVEASSLEKLFKIAANMHKSVLKNNAKRVLTVIKIDERRDKKISIESKLDSVRKRLKKTRVI